MSGQTSPEHQPDGGTQPVPMNAPDGRPSAMACALPPDEPIQNPGVPAHVWRPTDVDPAQEKRAERRIAGLFGLSTVCAVLFVVAYFTIDIGENHDTVLGLGASTVALGSALGGALLLIGIGIIQWARKLMADHEIVEMRHPARSSDEDREATWPSWSRGPRSHRPASAGPQLAARCRHRAPRPAVVLFRDLGPTNAQVTEDGDYPGAGLEHTVWDKGVRVVRDVVGTPIRPSAPRSGDLVNAEPETVFAVDDEGEPLLEGAAPGRQVQGRRRPHPDGPRRQHPRRGREDWAVDGILCYSRSAPTSAARSRSTSARPSTCCARATSRRSTSPTRRR